MYVNSNVGIWWAGWSYGGRRFDSCVVFFVIGAAAIFELLRRRPMILVLGLCGFFMLWSFGLMSQSRSGQIPPDRLVSFRDVSVNNVQRRSIKDSDTLPPRRSTGSLPGAIRSHQKNSTASSVTNGFGNLRLPFDAGSEAFMARGWGDPEMDPGRRWFRWSVGREAAILLPLKMPHTYELTVELAPYVNASPNRVWLRVNGQLDLERALAGETTLTWRLGERLWRLGINELHFFFQRTARPSDVSSSPDSRELGAAFYHLKLIALPDPP